MRQATYYDVLCPFLQAVLLEGDNSGKSDPSQTGVVVGAIAGGIAGALLIGVVSLLFYHKKRRPISFLASLGVSGADKYPDVVNRGVYGLPNVAPSSPNARKASMTPQAAIDPSTSFIIQQREILERALTPSQSDTGMTQTRYNSGSIFENPHALLSTPSTPTSSVPPTPSSATHLMMYPPSPTTDSALLYSPYANLRLDP